MRSRALLLTLVVPLVAPALLAQQPQQPQQQQGAPPPSVQVGVPAGRGAAPGIANPAGRGRGPAAPAPRNTAGRVLLGGENPKVKGVWLPGAGGGQDTGEAAPLQPWAQAVLANRRTFQLEPHTRCKPSGGIRQFLTPYGVEFVEMPEMQRLYIFDIGGPHTYRTVYMDGRTHPAKITPSYYGHSIGWWEGDTLVVDTTGFNDQTWFDKAGNFHSGALHVVERFTARSPETLTYEATIEDPNVFTRPWTMRMPLYRRVEANAQLLEFKCVEFAEDLIYGHLRKPGT